MKKVISLDIGGTNTRVALINEKYEIETSLILPTEVGNLQAFLKSVSSIIKKAIPSLDGVSAIAAGVPGRVRHDGYIYATMPNIDLHAEVRNWFISYANLCTVVAPPDLRQRIQEGLKAGLEAYND